MKRLLIAILMVSMVQGVFAHYCTDLSQMPISSQDRISLLLACLFYLFKADIVADSVQISFCKFLVKGERFKAC